MTGRSPRGVGRFIAALLVVYVAKQIVIAVLSPPFTGHDEVSHFGAIRIVAMERRYPTLWRDVLPPDLYEYQPFSIEWHERDTSPLYAAVHPPLYYLLVAPIYHASSHLRPEAIQYLLRCAAIPFGVLTVLFAWLLTREIYPGDAFLGVTVPTIVAFQPQISYEAAMVNNDALATALYSVVLYLLVATMIRGANTRRAAVLGIVAGLALLAKGTTITALALIPVALWIGRDRAHGYAVMKHVAVAFAIAVGLVTPWWWFMTRTYGDPMALGVMAATQPDLTRHDASFFQLLFSGRFLVDRWVETWGEFGWRLIHISPALVFALGLAATAGAVGVACAALSNRFDVEPLPSGGGSQQRASRTQANSDRSGDAGSTLPGDGATSHRSYVFGDLRSRHGALALLAAACLLSYVGIVQFGVRFVLTQARYFFPAVNAAVLLVMVGFRFWIPARWRVVAQALVVFAAIAVDVTIYTAYVVPYWYFR